MSVVAVLEKVYGSFRPETFQPYFLSLCKGLNVNLRIVGETNRGWIQIEVSGEDENVALHYLDQKIGLAPASIEKLKKFSTVRGKIIASGESENELLVDIGVFSPKIYDATVPLEFLQAQLADGKKLSIKQLIKLFCLCNNMPLTVKVVKCAHTQKERIEAELSETQLSQITNWIRSRLDRLIVLGAPVSDVEHAIQISKHTRDVVKVESLGILEHAVVCKLGTDAVGLIPKLGRILHQATLEPFCPKRIRESVNKPF